VRVSPGTGDQTSVPAQQRLRSDKETRPAGSWQDAADGSQQCSVGGLELEPRCLAAQHHELVTQDEDLQFLGGVAMGEQGKEPDGAAQRQVGKSGQHVGAASAMDQGRVMVPTHAA
jgi:hypothetical protein